MNPPQPPYSYNYSQFQPRRPAPPPPRRRRWPAVLLVMAIFAALGLLVQHLDAAAPVSRLLHHKVVPKRDINTAGLQAALAPIFANNPNIKIGVATVDVESGKAAQFGSLDPFVAASTAKIITAACYLHMVENGSATLNETVGGYAAQFQLQQMINQSNNDSWNALNDRIGLGNLAAYAHQNGAASYDIDDNALTPGDEAQVLQRLYTGKLLNASDTQLVLGYMQHTNNEDMIPAAGINGTIYHKYGLLDGNLHDVGIISSGQHGVALAIYTSGNDLSDYNARAALIQQIAKTIAPYYLGSG